MTILGNFVMSVVLLLAAVGGLRYFVVDVFGTKPTFTESVVSTCTDSGGTPGWVTWPEGCQNNDGEQITCYIEMCLITKP